MAATLILLVSVTRVPGLWLPWALFVFSLAMARAGTALEGALCSALLALGAFSSLAEGLWALSPAASVLLPLAGALVYTLPGAAAVWLSRSVAPQRRAAARLLLWPLTWTATETVSSALPLWGHWANPVQFGYAALDTRLLPLAAGAGVSGLSLVFCVLGALVAAAFRQGGQGRALAGLMTSTLMTAVLLTGTLLLGVPDAGPAGSGTGLQVQVVQGGMSADQQRRAGADLPLQEEIYRRYRVRLPCTARLKTKP